MHSLFLSNYGTLNTNNRLSCVSPNLSVWYIMFMQAAMKSKLLFCFYYILLHISPLKGVYNDILQLVTFHPINALPFILCCHGCIKRRMSYRKHFYYCKLKRHNISQSLVKHCTSSWQQPYNSLIQDWTVCLVRHKRHMFILYTR